MDANYAREGKPTIIEGSGVVTESQLPAIQVEAETPPSPFSPGYQYPLYPTTTARRYEGGNSWECARNPGGRQGGYGFSLIPICFFPMGNRKASQFFLLLIHRIVDPIISYS